MNKTTIIHKSRKNIESDSEKKIKGLLQSEITQKLTLLNQIQSKKFPNLRSELTNGCIIYKFPLRPQDYRYIYNGKIVPKRCKTFSIQELDAEKNKSKQFQDEDQTVKKRFSINKSISTIESQILGFAKNKDQYPNNLRRENRIPIMPRFFLQKKCKNFITIASHTLKRNQSQNVDINLRIRSISHIVSQQFRMPTESLSKDDRFD